MGLNMVELFCYLCYSIHGGSWNRHQDLFKSRPVLVTALPNRLCIHQRYRPLLYTKRQKTKLRTDASPTKHR